MFNFIKPKTVATVDESTLNQLFDEYHVNNQPIRHYVKGIKQQGSSLTLDLRLPDDCNPEQIHHDLSQKLHIHGVSEVNMNITLFDSTTAPKPTTKGSGSTLPKTTNAMPPVTQTAPKSDKLVTENPEPAIAKKATTQAELTPHPRIEHIIVVVSG